MRGRWGRSVSDRFWSKVVIRGKAECWSWMATKRAGYGLFKIDNKHRQATRVAYSFVFRPIPKKLSLDHLCRNTGCVNPWHLEAVPHRINVLRGIGPTAKNHQKSHCIGGHPLKGKNLYIDPHGGRHCRICIDRSRKKYERKLYVITTES